MEKITNNKYRTVDNGSLRLEDAGKTVKLAGWVDTIRKLGELTFVFQRDSYGKTQVVLNKEKLDVTGVEWCLSLQLLIFLWNSKFNSSVTNIISK